MSRIYVDRISPYQSGSVQVDGLSLDTGSLATKVELNTYTASNDSKVDSLIAATSSYQPAGNYATTGSNTFEGNQTFNVGDGAFALRANFNNSFFYSIGSTNTVGILKNDFSEATSMAQGTGFNTFNNISDISLAPNLNSVTSQGDDRPGLLSYSGSTAQDIIALPKKSWDNSGEVEFKTPIKISSNATVASNLLVSQSGASLQWQTDWPTNLNEKQITTFDGLTTAEGDAYNNNFQKIVNYGSFGAGLEGLVTSFNDSGASNYYSSQWFGPRTAYWTMSPSGSNGTESLIKLEKDGGSPTTTITVDANTINIGQSTAGNLNVGSSSNTTTVASNFVVSGSGANNQWITDWPTNFNEKQITTFGGLTTSEGDAYNENFHKITNYGGAGANLEGLVWSFNDSNSFNYGTSFWIGPRTAYWTLTPNGGTEALVRLQKDSGASTTTATIQANLVDINGPVDISETLKLTALDPLPAGQLGQLAVSGSNLYFHNGTNWIVK